MGSDERNEAVEGFARFLERFLGEVPRGPAGDAEMRRRDPNTFIDTTDADVRPDKLTDDQIGSWFSYASWHLWDTLVTRATEGESGLIPRQEYETIGFVQNWNRYPDALRAITDQIGVDGVVDLGRLSRRQVGSKLNQLRHYGIGVAPCLGRGIQVSLGLLKPEARREDVEAVVQFSRRVQHGAWGGGPGLVSGREYQIRILDDDVVEGLVAPVISVEDPDLLAAFRRFNASTELFGFLLHYDNRTGMGDTGPYPLPNGRIAIVRDHILGEGGFPWADVAEGLPYAVVETMVFPAANLEITINDIGTTFTKPPNYIQGLEAVSVLARDRSDTPMSELRPLGIEEMRTISERCEQAGFEMYQRLATKDRDQLILDGAMVYNRAFIQPYAEAVGVWDQLVADGFDELHEDTEAAWPTLTGGRAMEILLPVFLLGKGFPPLA